MLNIIFSDMHEEVFNIKGNKVIFIVDKKMNVVNIVDEEPFRKKVLNRGEE